VTNRAEKTVVATVRVGERWRFDEADWTIIGCVRGIVDLKREGEPVPSLYLLEDLLREGERLSEAPPARPEQPKKPTKRKKPMTRNYKHNFEAEAVGVPGAEPVRPGASDHAFSISDEIRLKAHVLLRATLALNGPATPAGAYSGVFCGAMVSVEAGISRTAYLDACNEEYTRAVEERKAARGCLDGGPCRADTGCGGSDRVEEPSEDPREVGYQAPVPSDRGVAGDRCGSGSECGRLGCPECQQ
jgi:hypothetical protein